MQRAFHYSAGSEELDNKLERKAGARLPAQCCLQPKEVERTSEAFIPSQCENPETTDASVPESSRVLQTRLERLSLSSREAAAFRSRGAASAPRIPQRADLERDTASVPSRFHHFLLLPGSTREGRH